MTVRPLGNDRPVLTARRSLLHNRFVMPPYRAGMGMPPHAVGAGPHAENREGWTGVMVVGSGGATEGSSVWVESPAGRRRRAAGAVRASPERAEAFDRYVVPELETLYRVALAITGDHAEAEDLVQDTVVRAFAAVDRFDGGHPRAWLLTILRNTHINRHRRRRPSLLADPADIDGLAEPPASAETGPEPAAMAAVFDEAVETALGSLGVEQRAVIALVDVDGLSYQEAADVLGIPVGTVMSRLHRGRKKVRRKLAASGLKTRRQ